MSIPPAMYLSTFCIPDIRHPDLLAIFGALMSIIQYIAEPAINSGEVRLNHLVVILPIITGGT